MKTKDMTDCHQSWSIMSNRNRNLETSKVPLKIQAQGTCLFTSAVSHQIEYSQRQVRCQRVGGDRVAVKTGAI